MLSGPLPEMIQRHVPVSTGKRLNGGLSEDDLAFSTTSVLNQRPTEILPGGLSENSKMNVRYTKRSRAPGPPMVNGHIPNGIANGHITTIAEDDEEDLDSNYADLSKKTRLNGRYMPNGDAKVPVDDLSHSKMNHRYSKKNNPGRSKSSGVSDQIRRSKRGDQVQSETSDHTDWSHLVEDIFNDALNDHEEQDGSRLGGRIKGGGQGVPGLQQPLTQPVQFPPVIPPVLNTLGSPTISTGGLVNSGISQSHTDDTFVSI